MNEKPDPSHYILLPASSRGPGAAGDGQVGTCSSCRKRVEGSGSRSKEARLSSTPTASGTYLRACYLLRRDLESLDGGQPG